MSQAILTRYHGPTSARPQGRIVAKTASGRDAHSAPFDPNLGAQENHKRAAQALARTLKCAGGWAGQPDSAHGFLFVFLPEAITFQT